MKLVILTQGHDTKWPVSLLVVPKNCIHDFEAFYNGHHDVRHDYNLLVSPAETYVVVQGDRPYFYRLAYMHCKKIEENRDF